LEVVAVLKTVRN